MSEVNRRFFESLVADSVKLDWATPVLLTRN